LALAKLANVIYEFVAGENQWFSPAPMLEAQFYTMKPVPYYKCLKFWPGKKTGG
jgi:hypothetical protein